MKIKHLLGLAAIAVSSFVSGKAMAQGMAVNTTGTAAAATAIMDVSSTTQGMLVPRMTQAQRDLIGSGSPATGLLIYQTDGTAGFYFYNGTAWTSLSGGGAPSGTAGGDLAGTYPNPTVAATAAAGNDIITAMNASAGGLSGTKLSTGTVPITTFSVTGTASVTTFLRGDKTWSSNAAGLTNLNGSAVAFGTVPQARLGSGTTDTTTFLRGDGTWTTPAGGAPSGAAGGSLSGSYPNPTIGSGVIANANVSSTAAIAYSKLNLLSSVASTDLAANAVTTGKIADAAVTTAKIADSVVTIAKLSKTGATSGQVIGFNGSTVAWTTPSGGGGSFGTLQFAGSGGVTSWTPASTATYVSNISSVSTNLGGMDASTGIFTAPSAGTYFISYGAQIAATSTPVTFTEVGGTKISGHTGSNSPAASTPFCSYTEIVTLTNGQSLRFLTTSNTATNSTLLSLMIYKL